MRKILGLFVLCLLIVQYSCTSPYNEIQNGISLNSDGYVITVTTKGDKAFRLGVRDAGDTKALESIFLGPSSTDNTKFSIIESNGNIGIETSYGKLLVNTESLNWWLTSNDKDLINAGVIIPGDTMQVFSFYSKGDAYGSGNLTTKELIKHEANTVMSNGTCDVPYLWNTSGFSVFGVTVSDDVPASWKSDNSGNYKWTFKGDAADMYLTISATAEDATKNLMSLTGKMQLPPKWTFGFMQSYWGWSSGEFIMEQAENFRNKKLPIDAFIYDFEWYTTKPDYAVKPKGEENFSDFDFNPALFSDPARQLKEIKDKNIKSIGIRKPRLGDKELLEMAHKKHWITEKSDYQNRDMDYRKPELREWYKEQNRSLVKAGLSDGWWLDEGEAYYSCYYWWTTSLLELNKEIKPNQRFFTLNRAFSPGAQRLGFITWNGDIHSQWKNLLETPADLLNWSLSGMFLGTCDIGGFGGDKEQPDVETVVRWYQAGVFFPIMRAHSNIFCTPRFPWLWDEEKIGKALNLRYQLLPYIYSLAHKAYAENVPMMRPLMMEYPNDEKVKGMTDQWFFGDGLMAAPVMNPGDKRLIYLPKGTWYDFFTGDKIDGGKTLNLDVARDEIPVYVKAGTIIPMGPVIQYADEKTDKPLEVRVFSGADAEFTLYEDDGSSEDYQNGAVRKTIFKWDDKSKTFSWNVSGSYSGGNIFKEINVVLGDNSKLLKIGKSGEIKL